MHFGDNVPAAVHLFQLQIPDFDASTCGKTHRRLRRLALWVKRPVGWRTSHHSYLVSLPWHKLRHVDHQSTRRSHDPDLAVLQTVLSEHGARPNLQLLQSGLQVGGRQLLRANF